MKCKNCQVSTEAKWEDTKGLCWNCNDLNIVSKYHKNADVKLTNEALTKLDKKVRPKKYNNPRADYQEAIDELLKTSILFNDGSTFNTTPGAVNIIKPSIDLAMKFDDNKPQLDMVPVEALEAAARAFAYGAKKYAKNNYKKGMKWSRLIAANLRHTYAFAHGEDLDKESALCHIDSAIASLAMLAYNIKHYPENDDR